MSTSNNQVRERLREIERAFTGFERGDRNRLYETRDSLVGLTGALESAACSHLGPLAEIASRMLGLVIMEGGLTEGRAVAVVRELLGYVEAQMMETASETPGGVFHVVNSEKVGDLLVRKGVISTEVVNKALLLQRVSNGRRIGQVLVAMNAIDQRTLDQTLEDQKAETRRAETRRSATGAAQQSSPAFALEPLPSLPPLPGPVAEGLPAAPLPSASSPEDSPGATAEPGINAPGLHLRSTTEPQEQPKLGLNWLDNK